MKSTICAEKILNDEISKFPLPTAREYFDYKTFPLFSMRGEFYLISGQQAVGCLVLTY